MNNKILILSLVLFISIFEVKAQVNTSSPYSRYGIGELENSTLGRAKGMGGIFSGLRLPYEINMNNPASYSAIPANVFLFQVGVKTKRTDYSSENSKDATNYDFSLASINAALRVNKYWGMSFGLTPISNIGYDIHTKDSVTQNNYTSNYDNHYIGDGGISQLYFGNSLSYKGLSVGVNAAYYFGSVNRRVESQLIDGSYQSYLFDREELKIKDFNFRYGIQYNDSIFKKYSFTIGGFLENKVNLNADKYHYISRTVIMGDYSTIKDTLLDEISSTNSVEMPMSYGFGFTFMTKQLIFGADYETSNWKDILMFGKSQSYYTNSSKLSFGIEYTNDYFSKNIFKTINFRLGAYMGNSNLYINDTQIKDNGVTFGFGVPTKLGSKINIAFGIGQRGSIVNNLVKENYYTVNLNFNLTDRWFIRRKFF